MVSPRSDDVHGAERTTRDAGLSGGGALSGAVPVRVVWNGYATLPADAILGRVLAARELEELTRKAAASTHPTFRLSDDVFVELPAPAWQGGDLLVYLPRRGWLVRRNKVEHWYVDIGVFRVVTAGLYGWTDLWLDVIAPEPAAHYHVLDADEFASALRYGQVTADLAALALEQLDALVRCMRAGEFPPPEVRHAEAFAEAYRAATSQQESVHIAGPPRRRGDPE